MGPLGRHAHTLAFGSAPLSKVILFNNSGTASPSGNGGVVDSIIRKPINNPEDGSMPLSPSAQGLRDLQVPRDFQIKTAYVRKRRHTTLHGGNKEGDT